MTSKGTFLSRFIREPLLQFLVLGAGLFLLYGYVGDTSTQRENLVVVDEAQVARLAEQFQRTWMRPPSRQELAGLAEEFVTEEILYREALALGLDKDDLIIRRRMRQKMEFLNSDLAEQREPSDAELQAYLDGHPDKFRLPARYSFRQVFLAPETSGLGSDPRALDLLERLRANPTLGADPQSLGDPTLLPPGLEQSSKRQIAAVFGGRFADAVAGLEQGGWSGPHGSAYGLHLIRVTGSEKSVLPRLEQIRAAVEREWSNDRRKAANERFHKALRDRYSIEIRLPDAAPHADNLAARSQ
jgi:hypothetical protein